jgi:hypothetical protein
MTGTKVVDLEKLYNFVVDNFFHVKSFIQWKLIWIYHFAKFSNKKLSKEVVELDDIYNFAIENIFIFLHLGSVILNAKRWTVGHLPFSPLFWQNGCLNEKNIRLNSQNNRLNENDVPPCSI